MSEGETYKTQAANLRKKQRNIFHKLERHIEAIQNLAKFSVKGQEENKNEQGPRSQVCENKDCGNSASLLTISGHVDIIRKIITAGKNNLRLNVPKDAKASREKALRNSLVLRTIMNHLDVDDLIRLRLVCKKWEEEATIQLSSARREAQIKQRYKTVFVWDEEDLEFQNQTGSLQELTETCFDGPRRKVPCTEFHFHRIKAHASTGEAPADLTNFISKHGHHINGLYINFIDSSAATCEIARRIIFEWATRVQYLTIGLPPDTDPNNAPQSLEDEPEPCSFSLPALQQLCCGTGESAAPPIAPRYKRLFHQILTAAPNLLKIVDTHFEFTAEIVSAQKIGAVDKATLNFAANSLSRVRRFAQARPQLTELECDLNLYVSTPSIAFLENLRLLLVSSSKSLKIFRSDGRLELTMNNYVMDVPILENLEELRLSKWSFIRNGQGRILPPGFSLQVSFPQLKTLTLKDLRYMEDSGDGDRDNPLAIEDHFSPTVTTLTIEPDLFSSFKRGWLGQALILYPNVQTLHLSIRQNWSELFMLCLTLWYTWKESLEQLEFTVMCHEGEGDKHFALKFDQILTGFDKDKCSRLRRQGGCVREPEGEQEEEEADEEGQRRPTILNMSRLKVFKINGLIRAGAPVFSHVAVTHALEPMRKRQGLEYSICGRKTVREMVERGNVVWW